jgi:hypothetical protein
MTTSKIKTHAIESESCKEEKVIILIRTNANAALATRKPKLWHPCSVSPNGGHYPPQCACDHSRGSVLGCSFCFLI